MILTTRRVAKGLKARASKMWWRHVAPLIKGRKCQCNACGAQVAGFYSYGGRPFGCPSCGASDRERWVIYALDHGLLVEPSPKARVLHIAPGERHLVKRLGQCAEYIGGDLEPELYPWARARRVDITDLTGLGAFDLVYASHVLEHIPDDRRAMRSVLAALKPGGQAWFMVPLAAGPTIEGGTDLTPRQREERYGQWDHVRLYGEDIVERLASEGFGVRTLDSGSIASGDRIRHGIPDGEKIFVCTPR